MPNIQHIQPALWPRIGDSYEVRVPFFAVRKRGAFCDTPRSELRAPDCSRVAFGTFPWRQDDPHSMVIRRPPSRLDYARYARWVGASHALAGILPALVPVIQGLGKIDAELDAEDSAYARRQTSAAKSSADLARFRLQESDRLTDRVNLSALWLLGAYEVARTLDEALRTGAHELPARLRQGVKVARLQLERPRMLLAKQTPARRQRSTDEAPAKPYILQGSMAWKVAPRKLISRRALADGFLEALEQLGVHHKRPREPQATARKSER